VTPLDALRAIHDELWDAGRGMDRFAPGVVPGVDLSSLNLHSVRESALGAFLDLEDGNVERAVVELRHVLELQYPASEWPWSGTFPVTAEQHDPPGADAVEWVHYDPNWRQFLGCILALTDIHHRSSLPADVAAAIDGALRRCVDGEPDDRIAPWYTNPNLMHAWLLGHVGATSGDAALIAAGELRVGRIVERFERHGDIDEYNSPTYDGIDLFALALWVMHPPTSTWQRSGLAMVERVGRRIGTLYHPRFGTTCGPYIRAYGLAPDRYVSLAGVAFHVAGQPADRVLPPVLDPDTVHVHDLYFLPVLARLAPAFVDHLDLREVTSPRHHVQRFTAAGAESLLRADLAVGWEHGRRHEASLDQYVPFSAHVEVGGTTTWLGIMVPAETAWVDCRRLADLDCEIRAAARSRRVGLRVVTGSAAVLGSDRVSVGPWDIEFDQAPDDVEERATAVGADVHLSWDADDIVVLIRRRDD
jgi:hypothetical protein